MNEEIIGFINWIGNNNYYKSIHTGYWQQNGYMYGEITHTTQISKTIEELYEIYNIIKL